MKVGKVYCCDTFAGTLTQDSEGFVFRYDDAYFANPSFEELGLVPAAEKTRRASVSGVQ